MRAVFFAGIILLTTTSVCRAQLPTLTWQAPQDPFHRVAPPLPPLNYPHTQSWQAGPAPRVYQPVQERPAFVLTRSEKGSVERRQVMGPVIQTGPPITGPVYTRTYFGPVISGPPLTGPVYTRQILGPVIPGPPIP